VMRIRKRNFVGCAIVLLIGCLVLAFLPETMAIAWHMRYGRTAKLANYAGSYDMRVPVLWWGLYDEGRWDITLINERGYLRRSLGDHRWARVTFSVKPEPVPGIERESALPQADRLMGTSTTTSRLTMAGQPMICFDSHRADQPQLADISCVPETTTRGLSVSFLGDRSLTNDFLVLLRGVTKNP